MPGYGACAHVQKRLLRERVPEPGINRSLTAQHLGNCDCKDCAFRLKLAWGANLKLVAARCLFKHIHPPITDYIPPCGSKLAIVQTISTRLWDSYWLVLFNYFSTFQINNAPEKVKLHKILFHFIVSLVPQILSSVSYNGRAGQCLFVSKCTLLLGNSLLSIKTAGMMKRVHCFTRTTNRADFHVTQFFDFIGWCLNYRIQNCAGVSPLLQPFNSPLPSYLVPLF